MSHSLNHTPITQQTESNTVTRLTFRGVTGCVYLLDDDHEVVSVDVLRGTGHGCTVSGQRPVGLLRFPTESEGPSAA